MTGSTAAKCAAAWRPAAAVTSALLQSNGDTGGMFAAADIGSSDACVRKLLRMPQAGFFPVLGRPTNDKDLADTSRGDVHQPIFLGLQVTQFRGLVGPILGLTDQLFLEGTLHSSGQSSTNHASSARFAQFAHPLEPSLGCGAQKKASLLDGAGSLHRCSAQVSSGWFQSVHSQRRAPR